MGAVGRWAGCRPARVPGAETARRPLLNAPALPTSGGPQFEQLWLQEAKLLECMNTFASNHPNKNVVRGQDVGGKMLLWGLTDYLHRLIISGRQV